MINKINLEVLRTELHVPRERGMDDKGEFGVMKSLPKSINNDTILILILLLKGRQ